MSTPAVNHHFVPHLHLTPPLPPSGNIILRESRRNFHPSFLIPNKLLYGTKKCSFWIASCLPSPQSHSTSRTRFNSSTKLFVSGLSFRTTEESLRNAFKNFGELVEVNLVMDKIAKRPRGFAFLRYSVEEESKKAIEGMHGKFLDGRVIFVEVAKSRTELRQGLNQNS